MLEYFLSVKAHYKALAGGVAFLWVGAGMISSGLIALSVAAFLSAVAMFVIGTVLWDIDSKK